MVMAIYSNIEGQIISLTVPQNGGNMPISVSQGLTNFKLILVGHNVEELIANCCDSQGNIISTISIPQTFFETVDEAGNLNRNFKTFQTLFEEDLGSVIDTKGHYITFEIRVLDSPAISEFEKKVELKFMKAPTVQYKDLNSISAGINDASLNLNDVLNAINNLLGQNFVNGFVAMTKSD